MPLLKRVCHAGWLNWDLDRIKLACSSKSYDPPRRNCRVLDSLGMVKTLACRFVAALLDPLATPSLVCPHPRSERLEAKPSTPVWTLSDEADEHMSLRGKRTSPPCASVSFWIRESRQPWGPRLAHLLDRSPISHKKWSHVGSAILIPLHLPHFSVGLRKLCSYGQIRQSTIRQSQRRNAVLDTGTLVTAGSSPKCLHGDGSKPIKKEVQQWQSISAEARTYCQIGQLLRLSFSEPVSR